MKINRFISVAIMLIFVTIYQTSAQTAIIPQPEKILELPGKFTLDKNTRIFLNQPNPMVKGVLDDFNEFIK